MAAITSSKMSEVLIQIGSGQELSVECTSSGLFPGRAVWRKLTNDTVNVTEINATKYFNAIADLDINTSQNELGSLFAYRYNNTKVVLGTRKTDTFGAAVGIREISQGDYECYADNNNANDSKILHLNVIGKVPIMAWYMYSYYFDVLSGPPSLMKESYVRLTTESVQRFAEKYLNSTHECIKCVLAVIGTAVLKSFSENADNVSDSIVSIDCSTENR